MTPPLAVGDAARRRRARGVLAEGLLLYGVFVPTVLVVAALLDGGRLRSHDAVAYVISGVFYVTFVIVITRRRRRDEVRAVRRDLLGAVRAGRLTDALPAEEWRPQLVRLRRSLRTSIGFTAGWFVVLVGLSITLAAIGDQTLLWNAFAVYFALLGAGMLVTAQRRAAATSSLLATLDG
ncbi:hypothetical protein AX769_02790 [Frondihabitans sp. PAMC 28766]|uniref:hypothetical protein n=1 Tax=Frondihabitans sp. PAMC 28766 TaxID=1795630 RepID=UPI00078DEF07|nr:hypothetical protein [Frondihabitans sp. PAMC 28766]AMM19254.1 hypothetical protein AX769_02790 [Frondihabitans sp. PAMC 28766]